MIKGLYLTLEVWGNFRNSVSEIRPGWHRKKKISFGWKIIVFFMKY